jgi:hypothetical protein
LLFSLSYCFAAIFSFHYSIIASMLISLFADWFHDTLHAMPLLHFISSRSIYYFSLAEIAFGFQLIFSMPFSRLIISSPLFSLRHFITTFDAIISDYFHYFTPLSLFSFELLPLSIRRLAFHWFSRYAMISADTSFSAAIAADIFDISLRFTIRHCFLRCRLFLLHIHYFDFFFCRHFTDYFDAAAISFSFTPIRHATPTFSLLFFATPISRFLLRQIDAERRHHRRSLRDIDWYFLSLFSFRFSLLISFLSLYYFRQIISSFFIIEPTLLVIFFHLISFSSSFHCSQVETEYISADIRCSQ